MKIHGCTCVSRLPVGILTAGGAGGVPSLLTLSQLGCGCHVGQCFHHNRVVSLLKEAAMPAAAVSSNDQAIAVFYGHRQNIDRMPILVDVVHYAETIVGANQSPASAKMPPYQPVFSVSTMVQLR
jgi:hypothetical protein